MRLLLQRVKHASVTVDGETVGEIGQGLLVFVGLAEEDSEALFEPALKKMVTLRIFQDEEGKMNRSLEDIGGGLLMVSQFTLYADARKGRRPSYRHAMAPEKSEPLFNQFVEHAAAHYPGKVASGQFAAMMDVKLLNDGPVTIWLDSQEMKWQ